jgi:hypothetical protein
MKKYCITLLGMLLVSSLAIASPRIIITKATLIDGINPDRPNMTMILDGDKIVSIADSQQPFSQRSSDKIIDAENKFIIPGLWDAHVHLTFIPEIDHKTYYDLFLKNGITSIRDTGAVMTKLAPAANYVSNNPYSTPRLFFSGPLIDGADRVYKGEEPGFPELSIGIDENSNIDQIVDNLVIQGATFLKSYEMLSRPTYLRLLDIAKQKGLRVTGHIPLSISLMDAIDAGLGGMQHIRNLELACANDAEGLQSVRADLLKNSANKAGSVLRSHIHSLQRYSAIGNFDEQRCTKIIQALARNNVFQTPTLTINTYGSQRFYTDQNWRNTYDYLPSPVKESWLAESIALSENSVDPNALVFENWSMKVVNLFSENNVKILAGTDTPIGFLTPGFSLHKELELLVKAGLSPRAALTSATLTPAEFFNLQTQMGSLDVGKVADILVLNKNPLEDIRHTQDINLVIAKGVIQSN